MAVKMELIPKAKNSIMKKILGNDKIVQLINSNKKEPFTDPLPVGDDRSNLIFSKIFPYQFSDDFTDEQTQIRVWFPNSDFSTSGVVEDTTVCFDIITHRNLIAMKDENGEYTERNELIAIEIGNIFSKNPKNNNTFNVMHLKSLTFKSRRSMITDSNYHLLRLTADVIFFCQQ